MNIRMQYLLAACLACGMASSEAKVWNVRDFGAVGDGAAKDTVAVQRAIGAWSRPEPGVDISNISFRNMTLEAKGFCKFYYKHATKSVFDGITFRHVRGKVREPSIFDDKPQRPFRNLRFEDVEIEGETSPRVLGASTSPVK